MILLLFDLFSDIIDELIHLSVFEIDAIFLQNLSYFASSVCTLGRRKRRPTAAPASAPLNTAKMM